MSPCAVFAPNALVLFPELTGTSWSACEDSEEPDEDNPFVPPDTEPQQFTEAELAALARDFLRRSETLIDLVAPPPWEHEDDIFGGEVFGEERAEYQQSSLANPTAEQKECIARNLMAIEAK